MKKKYLMWDETLFKDISVFDLDYIPENYLYRENQMKELAFCVNPAIKGARPVNALCLGPPGTGKTTAIYKLFEEINETTDNIITVYINCQLNDSRFAAFSVIFRKVYGYPLPSSGVPFSKVYESVLKKLVKERKVLIVALDDLNFLLYERSINEILYSLLRAHEEEPGVKIGVIGAMSDLKLPYTLDPRVESVFMPREIMFPLYEWKEIYDILLDRIKMGFYPDTVSEEVLEMITDKVVESGDLRMGIDLLKRAGLSAEQRASRQITVEDVEQVYEDSKRVFLKKGLRGLNQDELKLLDIIYSMPAKTTAGEVYKEAREIIKMGYTKFYEMINKLDAIKLIDVSFSGKGAKGRTRYILHRYESEMMLKALKEMEK
jgi:cell division control protein 6